MGGRRVEREGRGREGGKEFWEFVVDFLLLVWIWFGFGFVLFLKERKERKERSSLLSLFFVFKGERI